MDIANNTKTIQGPIEILCAERLPWANKSNNNTYKLIWGNKAKLKENNGSRQLPLQTPLPHLLEPP